MTTKRQVVHLLKLVVRSTHTRTTSLCGRVRTMQDGMNLTDKSPEVTCLFCLSKLSK